MISQSSILEPQASSILEPQGPITHAHTCAYARLNRYPHTRCGGIFLPPFSARLLSRVDYNMLLTHATILTTRHSFNSDKSGTWEGAVTSMIVPRSPASAGRCRVPRYNHAGDPPVPSTSFVAVKRVMCQMPGS